LTIPLLASSTTLTLKNLMLQTLPTCAFARLRDEDLDDNEYTRPPTPKRRNPPLSDVQKALSVLESLGNFWGFSVYKFLDTLFTSEDPTLKHSARSTRSHCGAIFGLPCLPAQAVEYLKASVDSERHFRAQGA